MCNWDCLVLAYQAYHNVPLPEWATPELASYWPELYKFKEMVEHGQPEVLRLKGGKYNLYAKGLISLDILFSKWLSRPQRSLSHTAHYVKISEMALLITLPKSQFLLSHYAEIYSYKKELFTNEDLILFLFSCHMSVGPMVDEVMSHIESMISGDLDERMRVFFYVAVSNISL